MPKENVAPNNAASIYRHYNHNVGDIRYNSAPSASAHTTGWICTTAGHWVKEAWTQGNTYAIGDIVSNGGKLYIATTAGVAGATAPTHSSGTASDGTVTWAHKSDATTSSVWTAF